VTAARPPLGIAGAAGLAVLERGGFPESVHLGAAAVTAPDGSVLRAVGDADADVLGRSALKPFQAVAVRRAGVPLEDAALVLAAASHAGTPEHVAVVRSLLAGGGVDETALGCPADRPLDRAAAAAQRAAGLPPSPVSMNCSGKHAAFLLACRAGGWPLESYLDPEHPLQERVRATVEEFTGDRISVTVVDGCGAPAHATSLAGLARGIGRISGAARRGGDPDAAALMAAVLAHPWALDGPGRANTTVIERLGVLAKGGAEGVLVLGAPDGTAVAVKVLDGSPRAAALVALELLAEAGAVDPTAARDVAEEVTERVLGGGRPVGRLRPVAPTASA